MVYLPTFVYIWVIIGVNVGKYTIHGASGDDSQSLYELGVQHPFRKTLCIRHSFGMEIPRTTIGNLHGAGAIRLIDLGEINGHSLVYQA